MDYITYTEKKSSLNHYKQELKMFKALVHYLTTIDYEDISYEDINGYISILKIMKDTIYCNIVKTRPKKN